MKLFEWVSLIQVIFRRLLWTRPTYNIVTLRDAASCTCMLLLHPFQNVFFFFLSSELATSEVEKGVQFEMQLYILDRSFWKTNKKKMV